MAIETLEDIIEEVLNVTGIYGAHDDDSSGTATELCSGSLKNMCRVCASANLEERIRAAVRVENILRRSAEGK